MSAPVWTTTSPHSSKETVPKLLILNEGGSYDLVSEQKDTNTLQVEMFNSPHPSPSGFDSLLLCHRFGQRLELNGML